MIGGVEMATRTKVIGPISAYAIAVANGYTGTEAQFAEQIANASANAARAEAAADHADAVTESLPADFYDVEKNFAPLYANLTFPVSAGQHCVYNGIYYAANTDIATSEAWTAAHWTRVNVGDEVNDLKSAVTAIDECESDGFRHVGNWVNGSWSGNIVLTDNTKRVRPEDFIYVKTGDVVTITNGSYKHAVGIWEGTLASHTQKRNDMSFVSDNETIDITFDGFIMVTFALASDTTANINPADFNGDITVTSYAMREITKTNAAYKEADNKITGKMVLAIPVNKCNPSNLENGYITANGTKGDNTSYRRLKTPIPVSEGDVIRFYSKNNSTGAFETVSFKYMCVYNDGLTVLENKGTNTSAASFTVPSGVAYINPTMNAPKQGYMITINYVATFYEDWFTEYYKADDGFVDFVPLANTDFNSTYLDYSMVNRLDPDDCQIGKTLSKNGTLSDNADYCVTDYMPIRQGETLRAYKKSTLAGVSFRFVCAYDSHKNVMENSGTNSESTSYTQSGDVAFIKATILYRSSDTTLQPANYMVVATDSPQGAVDYDNSPVFKSEYIPQTGVENLHVYLPKEIPVGIGRTIELYNELVCLEANKYHLHYSCSVGVQYARKFSITGSSAGTYTLTLRIYNDDQLIVWTGTSTVKVVSNSISSELKILPIGDSLTNLKPWLSEVQTLSNSKIKYIGTRGRNDSTIRHEGRSGLSAYDYNGQFDYDFDSNYQGAAGVSGDVNPFWSGSAFSLTYYNTQQAATVGTADAIQIFLGTNDIFGNYTAEESADHIKDLVDAIRADNSSIPIFVCNTIYRSNQNGYYSSGGQGFSAASGWAFDSDMKIMALQNALDTALAGYTGVYIIPLSVCMDREYDFGNVATAVNPRLTDVTIDIPNESVHPQNAGYMQIADVIYSSYVAHLS